MAKKPHGAGWVHPVTGYVYVRVGAKRYAQHRLVAERAIGKPLPPGAEVHHLNEDRRDNRPENLVIVPNRKYHFLLHIRQEALTATANADMRKCPYCQKYDAKPNMVQQHGQDESFMHRRCASAVSLPLQRARRATKRKAEA